MHTTPLPSQAIAAGDARRRAPAWYSTTLLTSDAEDHAVIAQNTIQGYDLDTHAVRVGDGIVGHFSSASIVANNIYLEDEVMIERGGDCGIILLSTATPYADPGATPAAINTNHTVVLGNHIKGSFFQSLKTESIGGTYATNCTIKDNHLRLTNSAAIYLSHITGWTVTGNYILEATGLAGIHLEHGGTDPTISYNRVQNAGGQLGQNGGGINIAISDPDVSNFRIADNDVVSCFGNGIKIWNPDGGTATGLVIVRNSSHGNTDGYDLYFENVNHGLDGAILFGNSYDTSYILR